MSYIAKKLIKDTVLAAQKARAEQLVKASEKGTLRTYVNIGTCFELIDTLSSQERAEYKAILQKVKPECLTDDELEVAQEELKILEDYEYLLNQ
jgi:hypothetical protein